MNLTKTQRKLLLAAAENRGGVVVTCLIGGRGPAGGLVSSGHRESSAACGLRDKGLVTRVKQIKSCVAHSGWTTHYAETVWAITEAGKTLAAELKEQE